ncbi:hypothetical protein L9F63_009651, partial [Diploptera punctata]
VKVAGTYNMHFEEGYKETECEMSRKELEVVVKNELQDDDDEEESKKSSGFNAVESGAATRSYTIMPVMSRAGKLMPKLLLILRELQVDYVKICFNKKVIALGFEPDFLYPLENVTIAQGRDAMFTCVVNNLGGYRVSADVAPARVLSVTVYETSP